MLQLDLEKKDNIRRKGDESRNIIAVVYEFFLSKEKL